jgi:hypothetical protein
MSKTKIDNITRSALWKSYNYKCFYCGEDIEWRNLEIDHIIPENLNSSEINNLINEYELDENFSYNDLYNLIPTHNNCNGRKGKYLFDKKTVLYYHGLTKKKLYKIEKEIETLKRKRNNSILYSKIQIALETDSISIDEIRKMIENKKRENWITQGIKLNKKLEFVDEIIDMFYIDSNLTDKILDKNIIFGSEKNIILHNNQDKTRKIHTLREWKNARDEGFYALTTYDIKASSYVTFIEDLVEVISKAQMPSFSFINNISLKDYDFLSPKIIQTINPDDNFLTKTKRTIGELIKEKKVQIENNNYYDFAIKYRSQITLLKEVFRADFNNDGLEEIFISGYTYVTDGTFGYGFSMILERSSKDNLLSPVQK